MSDWVITPREFWDRLQRDGPEQLVAFFLFEGSPFALRDWTEYCLLKREVADQLGVHPKSVVLVGSGRLGYSVSPSTKRPKLWRPFSKDSDFDIVVVDTPMFDRAWRESLIRGSKNPRQDCPKVLRQRHWNFYEGLVDSRCLPRGMEFTAFWNQTFGDLSVIAWNGQRRSCKAFLFREWFHAELYYAKSFARILRDVRSDRLPSPPADATA